MSPSQLRRLVVVGVMAVTASAIGIASVKGTSAVVPSAHAFWAGVAGNRFAIAATATATVPILLCGLGASLAFRAGLFDVGQPAQLVMGGLAAGSVAPFVPGPGFVVIAVSLLVGAIAGAAWAYGLGAFALVSGIALIIVSLIGNYLADGLSTLLTSTVVHDPAAAGVYQTRSVPSDAGLPILIARTSLHAGVLIAIGVWIVAVLALRSTVWGHRLRLFGLNPRFAALAGTDPRRFTRSTLALGASVSGLAGAIEVLGVFGNYQDGTLGGTASPAWMGLTLALLVPTSAIVLLPIAVLLAALQTGFSNVQIDVGVTSELALVVQALILIAAAFSSRALTRAHHRRRSQPRLRAPSGSARAILGEPEQVST